MTIVLICIVVAVGLALVGAYLLVSGRREERGELAGPSTYYRAPGQPPPRVRRRPPDEGEPTQAHPPPTEAHPAPELDATPELRPEREPAPEAEPAPEPAPVPAPATPAAAARPAPRESVRSPMPVASSPTDGAVRTAGRARLEAALERARARLSDDEEPADR